MPNHKVHAARDHVETLVGTSKDTALHELIWNAFDAGGKQVAVTVHTNNLDAVERLEVADHGLGIPFPAVEAAFGPIGASEKVGKQSNPEGRAYHGRAGRGRFRSLAIGTRVRWTTTYKDATGAAFTYTIELKSESPDEYKTTEPIPADQPQTGTLVVVDQIKDNYFSPDNTEWQSALTEGFAYYLKSYPDVRLVCNGQTVDIASMISHEEEVAVPAVAKGDPPTRMVVIEWKVKPEGKKLHICDETGFSFFDQPAGVNAPGIDYTAYLLAPQAREWAKKDRFATAGLDGEIQALIKRAKESLRKHVRRRQAECAKSVVDEWKEQGVYPYKAPAQSGSVDEAERQVFDIVAVQVHEHHDSFSSSDKESKRLTLALIREALEGNPTHLKRVLQEVLKLDAAQIEAFADLLDRTPLANIVRASRLISDRLDTIAAFNHIIFDSDWRKRLLERTQLHRLLVRELWILGEEYTLATDDEGLRDVLKKHLSIMGRAELAAEVQDVKLIDGSDGIPDLMLYRKRPLDRGAFEHLVVELKRPSCKLAQEETGQLKKYAFKVLSDERFDTTKCSWEFVLIGNDYDEFVAQESSEQGRPPGCIHVSPRARIWVKKWADVLNEARFRYDFYRTSLELEASQDRGLELLKTKWPHLFEGRGATKPKDLAAKP